MSFISSLSKCFNNHRFHDKNGTMRVFLFCINYLICWALEFLRSTTKPSEVNNRRFWVTDKRWQINFYILTKRELVCLFYSVLLNGSVLLIYVKWMTWLLMDCGNTFQPLKLIIPEHCCFYSQPLPYNINISDIYWDIINLYISRLSRDSWPWQVITNCLGIG